MNHASIDSVLLKRPYLRLVKGDMYDIARRIKEVEEGYFIVFNTRNEKYEVHSTFNKGWNTYCFTVPYDQLDIRTLHLCRETSLALHGDNILKNMEAENEKIDQAQEKDYQRTMSDGAAETAEMVAFGIDEDELHEGYKKTHVVGGIA